MTKDNGMDVTPSWDELRKSVDILRSMGDALQKERDALDMTRQRLLDERNQALKERDALAAYGARLRGLGQLVREAATDLAHIGTEELFDRAEKWDAALNDEPATSRDRLKAKWQAEGALAIRHLVQGDDWEDQDLRDVIDDFVAGLRHQASGGDS